MHHLIVGRVWCSRYNCREGMKGRSDSPGRKMFDARKCCSCRRGFGTRRADPARKGGPLAEQAIRYPEAALGSHWYPNAGTGLRTLKLFLKRHGALREGHCVDTFCGRVDTRPSIQKTLFGQMGQCVDTLSGSVDTFRLKLKNLNFSGHVAAW
ncbi:hypothetical protein Taro_028979, partial [Colocasia esculenta]|nr:hypothetical protein [Colocasia esculenta]